VLIAPVRLLPNYASERVRRWFDLWYNGDTRPCPSLRAGFGLE